ncbi:AfsR/SARP family transcriptional regulator [Salinispora oceanensis]|uniref:AfsR/SARP family transcriptional regulator n=1 Tax=Salinispora oceanensis TaxID=1050199 RepID=UPI0003A8D278|nr:BTAD domain-containing putative transcriptional regulator [Salinispora oceanensis]
MTRFRMLGTLEVTNGGTRITPSAPKLRRVLALLAARADSLVQTRQLADELWEDCPPSSWQTTLQTYIYQLRKLLDRSAGRDGSTSGVLLRTRPSGYLLELPPEALDVRHFEELARHGREALARGHVEAAAETLHEALALWRGPVLSDVQVGPVLRGDVVRLEELRNSVLEARLDADLQLGRHTELISELSAHVARSPTHENLHARLMIALYRVGRRSEALGVFRRVRQALIEEFGLEPGPELQRLHRAVLAADPGLAHPNGVLGGEAVRAIDPPAQLPPDVPIVGRERELVYLVKFLTDRKRQSPATLSVTGPPGVGSSAFCVHAAHSVQGEFPDGQFYASFSDPNTKPGEVLAGFLQATGVPASRIPEGMAARAAMFRGWTARRRALVVLDHMSHAEQLGPLLPSGAGCATLIAGLRRLDVPAAGAMVELAPLSEEAGLQLLATVAGQSRVDRDLESARQLVRICGGLPLALRSAAARLVLRPHWQIRHLTDRLDSGGGWAAAGTESELDVVASVSARYRLLPQAEAAICRRLVLQAQEPLTVDSAAEMLNADPVTAESALERLVEVQLASVDSEREEGRIFVYRIDPAVRMMTQRVFLEIDRPLASVSELPRPGARRTVAASQEGVTRT